MPEVNTLEATSPRINAVVSASAGTGKTWLLVTRLLRLLLAGETPASILAVTFTQKAAAEIRERLIATLRRWTQLGEAELEEELSRLAGTERQFKQARQLYEDLIYAESDIRILTFHAFCTEILERFPLAANIPPAFEICHEQAELHEEALDQLYIEAADKDAPMPLCNALQTLFESCGGLTGTNRALNAFLSHRNDWSAYTEGFENPVGEACLHLAEMLGITLDEIEKDIEIDKKTCEAIEKHRCFVSAHPTQTNKKIANSIDSFLASDKRINNPSWEALLECFFTKKGEPRKREYRSKVFRKKLGEKQYQRFENNWRLVVESLAAFKDAFLKRESLRRNRAWYTAGQRLVDIYRRLKLSRQQLDFDDLEWHACRLMNHEKNAHWIQSRLNSQIRHILVDEFQDTNPHQWQLLKPLLEEMASQENAGSAFIVGDVKQSIYGFRRADPSLQHQAQQWLQQRMQGQVYTSDCSRRSAPAIIDFINRVFGDGDKLKLPVDFRQHRTDREIPGGVSFLPFVEKPEGESEQRIWRQILRDRPTQSVDHPAAQEGRQIAQWIKQMVDESIAIYDRDKLPHPLRFGDITLLLRRRTHLDHYERALREAQIPHTSGHAEKMFDSLEIHDLLSLLSLLLNNRRKLDLAQVLRSPIFSIDDEQLLSLAAERYWFAKLGRMTDDKPLRLAHELISGWIEAARARLPVHDLLDKIYREGDLINRYRLAASDQEKELTEKNLLDFLDYSLEFESGRYPDLASFTKYMRRHMARIKKAKSVTSPRSYSEPDATDRVRIMTIHQAKGLEAPVIILADCGKPPKKSNAHSILADWPTAGNRPEHFLLIPRAADTDSFTQACHELLTQREDQENSNLLYVALTRTRQYLLISGSSGKLENSWYELLESHARESELQPQIAGSAICTERTAATPTRPETSYQPRSALPAATALEIHPSTLIDPVATGPHAGPASATGDTARLRGHIIHRALQALSEDKGNDAVQSILASNFPGKEKHFPECLKSARKLIARESLRELFDSTRYEQVLNETPISFTHDGEQYFGVVDRICIDKNMVWIVDYKTHRLPQNRIEEIKALYAEQMHVYYLGVSKLWPGHKIRTSLLLTETAQLCDYDFA